MNDILKKHRIIFFKKMQQELFKLQWEQMLGALWLYVSSVNPILIRDRKFTEGEKLQSIRSQEVSNAYRIA